ncbi:MAG: hypothetical protein SNJ57_07355 [Cyanobacteriota bacterium]
MRRSPTQALTGLDERSHAAARSHSGANQCPRVGGRGYQLGLINRI